MFLFILESIGTSELILIAVIALVFLGPRKLPQIAKTIGKVMADFRNTTNDFKSTWEKEVNFEEEEKLLKTGELEANPVARVTTLNGDENDTVAAPTIKAMDKESFDNIVAKEAGVSDETDVEEKPEKDDLSDKRNWL